MWEVFRYEREVLKVEEESGDGTRRFKKRLELSKVYKRSFWMVRSMRRKRLI